ncbi:MAG: beta-N-acetylhexosaminidase, partial [Bacteroidales bacterium]|nr:beta-N-acetylhexosaminidase [Bacteroidales bacterium]
LLTYLLLSTPLLTMAGHADYHVVPLPKTVQTDTANVFTLQTGMGIAYDSNNPEISRTATFLSQWVEELTGIKLQLTPDDKKAAVKFQLTPFDKKAGNRPVTDLPAQQEEAYTLTVNKKGVVLKALNPVGLFRAAQTLRKSLPLITAGTVELPFTSIADEPRFSYRGIHLDCARHFFTVSVVKRYIDLLALHGCNQLHWHLTDDQGWRIEIKSYPRLTEVGAWRDGTCVGKDFESNDGIRYGGFYTQEQRREIVDYAAARGIEVIPEVDLPGHMVAALAAYPELGCTGGPYKVWPRWGIAPDILCAGNDKVFDFLESVLSEVIDIFPSEYIHIGGDECFDPYAKNTVYPWDVCPKCAARMRKLGIKKGPEAKHLLQSYVTARVQKFVNSKGRRIIGWDEILEGELAEGATVMSWRGVDGGIKAASLGFDAIMTPHTYAYFDYYQSKERDKEPLCIGGYLPLENVYAYEPFDGLAPGAEDHILGVQANLWTEYITTPEHLEYMLLPRMCALSEIQWCDADKKDYTRFCTSLDHTFEILDAMGVNYCLDYKGLIGFDRKPARDSVELAEYLEAAKASWGW